MDVDVAALELLVDASVDEEVGASALRFCLRFLARVSRYSLDAVRSKTIEMPDGYGPIPKQAIFNNIDEIT